MFGESKNVIFVKRGEVEGVVVSSGKAKFRIKEVWAPGHLSEAMDTIISKLKASSVYVLLGDDIVYYLELTIPSILHKEKERHFIFDKMKEIVPEDLHEDSWDYKELEKGKNDKKIIAFAPVADLFQAISDALRKNNCVAIAVEPEKMAKKRNADVAIGISQKKDIEGKDEETLNLKLLPEKRRDTVKKIDVQKNTNESAIDAIEQKEPQALRKGYLLAFLVVFVLGVLLIGGILYFRSTQVVKSNKKTPVVSVTVSPVQEEATTTAVLNIAGLSVDVLNGSGIVGQATVISDLLQENGFVDIDTGNADNYDYTDTIVRVKEGSQSAELTAKLKEILKNYSVVVEGPLQKDSDYDAIIIAGKNEN